MSDGKMYTRTAIDAYIDRDVEADSDFLVDILNEYKGQNVQIVINGLGVPWSS